MNLRSLVVFPMAPAGPARVLALALLFAMVPAQAAPAPVPSDSARRASASLDFRIVIPERISVTAQNAPPAAAHRGQHRSVEHRADRTVITVAQP